MFDQYPELAAFLRQHPKVGVVDGAHAVPVAQLRWIQETGGRVMLVLDGRAMAAVVSLEDLHTLEASDPAERMK